MMSTQKKNFDKPKKTDETDTFMCIYIYYTIEKTNNQWNNINHIYTEQSMTNN